jgi:hypothetical protein
VVVTCSMSNICMKNEKNHKLVYDESDWSDPENVLNIHHKITYRRERAVWNFINNQNLLDHQIEVTCLIMGMC